MNTTKASFKRLNDALQRLLIEPKISRSPGSSIVVDYNIEDFISQQEIMKLRMNTTK